MKRYSLNLGQTMSHKPEHPERTATKAGAGMFADIVFQEWPNRKSMAVSIRMQERGPCGNGKWQACVKLTDGEGF
jgi:hypothetical protein